MFTKYFLSSNFFNSHFLLNGPNQYSVVLSALCSLLTLSGDCTRNCNPKAAKRIDAVKHRWAAIGDRVGGSSFWQPRSRNARVLCRKVNRRTMQLGEIYDRDCLCLTFEHFSCVFSKDCIFVLLGLRMSSEVLVYW